MRTQKEGEIVNYNGMDLHENRVAEDPDSPVHTTPT